MEGDHEPLHSKEIQGARALRPSRPGLPPPPDPLPIKASPPAKRLSLVPRSFRHLGRHAETARAPQELAREGSRHPSLLGAL
eukprot:4084067-Pyramimonas_sp.AAC.1